MIWQITILINQSTNPATNQENCRMQIGVKEQIGKWVVPENIYSSRMEEIFPNISVPLWKFQLTECHTFFKPLPQEILISSVGGVWIFYGAAQYNKLFSH